jgi:hypothetical protein
MVFAYACNVSSLVTDTPIFQVADAFLNTKKAVAKDLIEQK